MISASRQVSRQMLDHLELTNYQSGLLSRGVQPRMDQSERFDRVLDITIGYAGLVGVMVIDKMAYLNEQVGSLLLVNGLVN